MRQLYDIKKYSGGAQDSTKTLNMRKFLSLTAALGLTFIACSSMQRNPAGDRAPSSRSPSAHLDENRKIDCSDPSYVNEPAEFNLLFRRYLGVLDDSLENYMSGASSAAQKARLKASFLRARERYRWEILHYVSTRDPKSCFTPELDVMTVCAQVNMSRKFETVNGALKLQLANGFDLVRPRALSSTGYLSSWKLTYRKDPNQIAAVLSDKDGDGFIDHWLFAGKLRSKVTTSTREFLGVSWSVEETHYGFDAARQRDLRTTGLGDSLRWMDSGSLCTSMFSDPMRMIGYASKSEAWMLTESIVTRNQIANAAFAGFLTGYQIGTRGAVMGATALAKDTAQGIYVLGKGAAMGVKDIAAALSRRSTYENLHRSLKTFQSNLGDTLAQCYVEHGESLMFALQCTEEKYLRKAVELGGSAASEAQELGAQAVTWARNKIRQCTTVSGNEEAFAECMGQISLLAATSAAGGGIANASSRLALTSTNAGTRILGRAGVLTAEWVIDPIGIGTFGTTQFSRLSAAIKRVQRDLPKLTEADQLAIRKYLEDVGAHTLRADGTPPPRLTDEVIGRLRSAGGWNERDLAALVRGALDDMPPKVRQVRDELSLVSHHGVRHSPSVVHDTLMKINRLPEGPQRDFALDVVRQLAPTALEDVVRRNTTLALIDNAYRLFAKDPSFILDPDRLAKSINTWDTPALESVLRTFSESADDLSRNSSKNAREALEASFRRNGSSRQSLAHWMGCLFEVCVRTGGAR